MNTIQSDDSQQNAIIPVAAMQTLRRTKQQFQFLLDKSVPQTTPRWIALGALMLLYVVRVYTLQGFYIVTYGLGIFLLNLLIGFVSPLDEDMLSQGEGVSQQQPNQFHTAIVTCNQRCCLSFQQCSHKMQQVLHRFNFAID